jgi:two-component system cell cycle response regulator
MRQKILTVDDSRTVRLIVRKAFKPFDCEILEASNGVEGLAAAAKAQPTLILLDITMPVMDGVEMLTRLKADPQLRGIPVIMLTAEGGRDNVVNIAKLGVRGYIVKPFQDEMMIAKVGQLIELKPAAQPATAPRTMLDPLDILVVEDKPGILHQIEQGLKDTPWRIHGVPTAADATEFCGRAAPDLIVMSLSLPEQAAFGLFRALRANPLTKYLPIFALVVKTDGDGQQQALQAGFTAVVTKPLDLPDLRSRIAKALHLDTSTNYFRVDGECLVVRLPENSNAAVLMDAGQYLGAQLTASVDAGRSGVILDLQSVRGLHIGIIKFLVLAMQSGRELGMRLSIVGHPALIGECRGYEDTRGWSFHESLAAAQGALTVAPQAMPL